VESVFRNNLTAVDFPMGNYENHISYLRKQRLKNN
jgi:hypothetical protein